MRKSILVALLVIAVGLSALSACGRDTDSDSSTTLLSQVSNLQSKVSAQETRDDKLGTLVLDLASE